MKNIDYEKGLARIARTFALLFGAGLVLILMYSSKSWLSFGLHLAIAFISLVTVAKVCFIIIVTALAILLIRFFIRGFHCKDFVGQQEIGTNKVRNRIIISILVIVLTTCSSIGYFLYSWYCQTHTGSRSGRVIDAETEKPIEGAIVNYTWKFSKFMTMGGGIAASYETTTDKDGFYLIPNQRVVSHFVTSKHVIKRDLLIDILKREEVYIYKDGYAAYQIMPSKTQEYRKKNNLARLYPLKNDDMLQTDLESNKNHSNEKELRNEN